MSLALRWIIFRNFCGAPGDVRLQILHDSLRVQLSESLKERGV